MIRLIVLYTIRTPTGTPALTGDGRNRWKLGHVVTVRTGEYRGERDTVRISDWPAPQDLLQVV